MVISMKVQKNCHYRIIGFAANCPKNYLQKLLCMGFLPQAVLSVTRKSIFGGPCQISIKNTSISMRLRELNYLKLEEVA